MSTEVEEHQSQPLRVSAIIPTHNRPRTLERVLERLRGSPIDEVVIVDNGSSVELGPLAKRFGARLMRLPINSGITARNVGAQVANGELLLMLDDDSYPQEGSVEQMVELFARRPGLGVVGGKVVDMDARDAEVLRTGEEVGSFHWLSTFGFPTSASSTSAGMPTFFAAEGACMIRRRAHLGVGGFFGLYFRDLAELDLATRLIAGGWDVEYLPSASFNHIHTEEWRIDTALHLRMRVRNQIWYFVRHFSYRQAIPRILAYLIFDLIDCVYRGSPSSWTNGIADAWRGRDPVRMTRAPLDPSLVRRIELGRQRAHLVLLGHGLRVRALRLVRRS